MEVIGWLIIFIGKNEKEKGQGEEYLKKLQELNLLNKNVTPMLITEDDY